MFWLTPSNDERFIIQLLILIKIDTYTQNRYQIDTTFLASGIYKYQVYKIESGHLDDDNTVCLIL